MVPRIFVSSTIADLTYLRESVRSLLKKDLGYLPIMSEHNEVSFTPDVSAQDACYDSVTDCQILIVIIGKKYGSLSDDNNLSVTQREFAQARKVGIRTYCLVDRQVIHNKSVAAANPGKELKYDDMDEPQKTFDFIQEIKDAGQNNAILDFGSVEEAVEAMRKQFAGFFGTLLAGQSGDVREGMKDVRSKLAEIHELVSKGEALVDQDNARKHAAAMRVLLEDRYEPLMSLFEVLASPVEVAIPAICSENSLDDVLRKLDSNVAIDDTLDDEHMRFHERDDFMTFHVGISRDVEGRLYPARPKLHWGMTEDNRLIGNRAAIEYLRALYEHYKNNL